MYVCHFERNFYTNANSTRATVFKLAEKVKFCIVKGRQEAQVIVSFYFQINKETSLAFIQHIYSLVALIYN